MKLPTEQEFEFLNVLRDLAYDEAKNKGFHSKDEEDVSIDALAKYCMNLDGEVAELWEAGRKGKLNEPCDKAEVMAANGLPVLTACEEEIADICIRLCDTAKALNVNLSRAVLGKILFNRLREHRNGGKLA